MTFLSGFLRMGSGYLTFQDKVSLPDVLVHDSAERGTRLPGCLNVGLCLFHFISLWQMAFSKQLVTIPPLPLALFQCDYDIPPIEMWVLCFLFVNLVVFCDFL